MQRGPVQEELRERAFDMTAEQFEQFCKILVEQTEQTTHIELTPFHGDQGVDITGAIGRDFYSAQFGIQVKLFENNIGSPSMRNFVGALSHHDYQFGGFITSSDFSTGAVDVAEQERGTPIRLIDGEQLTEIMITRQLGVEVSDDEFLIDEEFWEMFDTSTGEDLVKSDAVPQADKFDHLNIVLQGIDNGYRYKHQITQYLIDQTGEDWDPRQADYYPHAGWALGYVHKDAEGEYKGRKMRMWGLTRDGQEYVSYLKDGDSESAEESLVEHIRQADIIEVILDRLRDEEVLTHDELGDVIEEESELNDTTAHRRKGTVGNWLERLPEVRKAREGHSLRWEYLEKNLTDY